jgi:alpha-N-arabinofuranosidase
MYGDWQIGALDAESYVKKARAFATLMKRTDPNIALIACGQHGWNSWDQIVLEGLAPIVDFHSIHLYTGHSDYYVNVFQPHQAERAIRICESTIERVRYNQRVSHPIAIAFDEWNVWYRTRSRADQVAGIEERYDLADALAVAAYLNIFIRNSRIVRIANFAQLVNAIAPIVTNSRALFLQTIYHPLRLYAEHAREIALDVHVECETYSLSPTIEEGGVGRRVQVADLGPFKMLDASATCDPTGRNVTLAVVNRDPDRTHSATIRFTGTATVAGVNVAEVNGANPRATNSFEQPEAVTVKEGRLNAGGTDVEYAFPRHSVTLLRFVLS